MLTIQEQLLNGTIEPQAVKRVEIERPDGGRMRKLGMPPQNKPARSGAEEGEVWYGPRD